MKDLNSKRVHDIFYKEEDHFTNPKEYFKKAFKIIKSKSELFDKENDLSFLDIGCAAGDFLRYFESQLYKKNNIKFFGIDIMPELLEEAKKRFEKGIFKKVDIGNSKQDLEKIFKSKLDLITMFGVSCIFDDLIWLDNIFSGIKHDGIALLYGIFNPYPYDVIIRVKKSESNNWEPGWNVISKKTISDYCNNNGFIAEFIDFEPDISIKPNSKDGLRSWSVDIAKPNKKIGIPLEQKRKRIFTSANRLIYDWSFCLIKKKKID